MTFLAAITIVFSGAVAQIAAQDDSNKQRKQAQVVNTTIVVTATRSEQPGDALPLSVTVINEKQVEEAPALRVEDALRSLPGVSLPSTNSGGHYITTNNISIRGLGPNRALVLVDGVPLNDAYRGYVHWDQVPPDTIERVELVRGGNASLFGNLALGGTINLITKKVSETGVDVSVMGGSRDTRQLDATFAKAFGNGSGIALTVNRLQTDGYIRTVPEERRPIDVASPADTIFVQARADFSPSDRFHSSLRASHFDFDLGLGTPLWKSTNKSSDFSGNTHLALGRSADLATSFFYRDQGETSNFVSVSSTGDSERVTSLYDTPVKDMGVSVSWTSSATTAVPLVGIGVDVRHSEMQDRKTNVSNGLPTSVMLSAGSQDSVGLFGQLGWSPLPDFELLFSGRLDYWRNFDGKEGTVGGQMRSYTPKTLVQFDPRISARYRISNSTAVRGAVYRAFRAPMLADLYRSNFRRTPNPALGPEVMVGGETGVDFAKNRWRLEANLFWNRLRDTISDIPISYTPFVTVQPTNLGETRSRGLELIGSVEIDRHWSMQASYAYTDSTITENDAVPSVVGNRMNRVPKHSGLLSLRYSSDAGAWAVVRYRAQSKTYAEIDNLNKLDSYGLVDISFAWPVTRTIDFVLVGENVFDRQYVGDFSLFDRLGQPRTITAGFRAHLGR